MAGLAQRQLSIYSAHNVSPFFSSPGGRVVTLGRSTFGRMMRRCFWERLREAWYLSLGTIGEEDCRLAVVAEIL